jgi:hypothetical protein
VKDRISETNVVAQYNFMPDTRKQAEGTTENNVPNSADISTLKSQICKEEHERKHFNPFAHFLHERCL